MSEHTIPSSWTAPTTCFASTNYYYVLLGGGYFSNMYGTPTPVLTGITPSGPCFPPSFTIDEPYYTTGGCPSGYTLACATATTTTSSEPASMVTCCPSIDGNVFSFMCKDNQYGCHATATPGVVWTGVVTDIGLPTPTEQPVTRTPSTAEGIEAWGIKLLAVSPSTASSTRPPTSATTSLAASTTTFQTTTAPTTAPPASITSTISTQGGGSNGTSTSSSGGSLSAGAVAGVSVGSALVAILLTIGAIILYRRKRRRNNQATDANMAPALPPLREEYKINPRDMPYQLDGQDVPPPGSRIWELPE